MIPINLLIKYQMAFEGETTEEVKERYGDEFYSVFLTQTDHIPNKIIESLVENLADATALNFITVFIGIIPSNITANGIGSLRYLSVNNRGSSSGEASFRAVGRWK